MGRMLGSFADTEELDRPDLNKCPDCGCFFPQDNCPLCGKPCPEEMRAGNRKPPKKSKKRSTVSDRVVFIEWYHSWWFIILMLFMFPVIGIVLLITSPHKRGLKIGIAAAAVVYTIVSSIGIGTIVGGVTALFDRPVDTSMSRDEYIAACATISPEDFYRGAVGYEEQFVSMTLTVSRRINAGSEFYYLCSGGAGKFSLLMRDCFVDQSLNLLPGDTVIVYGEGAGNVTVYDEAYNAYTAPCVNAAYIVVPR
ncbi:MAG: hypothetical protein IJX53_07500 [Clostridia bacterium]|nr:hypothetical protein [Clostridia bacterium]